MKPLVSALTALVALCWLPACITTYSGGGAVPTEQAFADYGLQPRSVDDDERARFDALLGQLPARVPDLPLGWWDFGGNPEVRARSANEDVVSAVFTSGFWIPSAWHAFAVPGPDGDTRFGTRERLFIPGFPFIWPVWWSSQKTFALGSGVQVADASMFLLGLGLLFGRTEEVAPAFQAEGDGFSWDPTRSQLCLFTWIAGGLVGWGQVNDTNYVQILWIGIPVGSAH